MKSIILVGALLLLSGVTYGQEKKIKVKMNPKRVSLKLPKSQPGTNSVKPAENSRKRPGGTIHTKPKTSGQKSSGTKPKPEPTKAVEKK